VPDLPPHHAGRVVDPSVADEDDVPVEQLSVEPPPAEAEPPARPPPERAEPVPDAPALRPRTFPPLPSSEVLLDPSTEPPPIPSRRPRRPAATALSPSMTALFGTLFGLAGIFALFALLQRVSPHPTPSMTAPSGSASIAAARPAASRPPPEPLPELDDGPGLPGPWRLAAFKDDEGVRVIEGTVGLDPLIETLQSRHVTKKETYRLVAAFKGLAVFDKPGRSTKWAVALERASGRVKAFELEVSAVEIYQARENEQQQLAAGKLDMKVGTRRTLAAVRVGEELAIDLRRARLRESVAEVVDRAFDGRAHLAGLGRGATLRLAVVEQTALGRFVGYERVEALEHVPARQGAEPLRIYRFLDGNHWGYFDQRGREPYRGGWRRPCPGAPVTSHFNPKRMHPVLHVVKPHLGTDFGAPSGTPIHACSWGQVTWVGPQGPAGNLVTIQHAGNVESYYMHMSRFAAGLHVGDKVETFQVIGYVGSTGRSTGPHLHFGVKKAGQWIDPLSLKLDGERTLSKESRGEFEAARRELDALLDSIPLPPPLEGEEPAVAASASGAAAPSASAPPAEGEEDLDELEPEGTPDPNDKPEPKRGKK
jgi:murein DD-endopeptidase MepM/ murein hydrolase activator NlpD